MPVLLCFAALPWPYGLDCGVRGLVETRQRSFLQLVALSRPVHPDLFVGAWEFKRGSLGERMTDVAWARLREVNGGSWLWQSVRGMRNGWPTLCASATRLRVFSFGPGGAFGLEG